MIRVAICDDDIVFTTRVEELILDFGRAYSFEICIYFESIYRKIYIHTKQGTDYFYGKLSDTEEELENSVIPFIRIHQSYLVNYHHISQYQSSKIIMESGAELTVSTVHRAYVKEKIHELLRLD